MNISPVVHKEVGTYVTYKDVVHVVVKVMGHRLQLLNPLEGNKKVLVLRTNTGVTSFRPMTIVNCDGQGNLLVSASCTIISLLTGRVMKWDESAPEHKAIMAMFAIRQSS